MARDVVVTERTYAEELSLAYRVTGPATRALIERIKLPRGSRGLDAGCGIGQHLLWLAASLGQATQLTGLDKDAGNLAAARRLIARPSRSGADRTAEGDLRALPFADATFDWLWCADAMWPVMLSTHPNEAVAELVRVLRPGGTLALIYWSDQCLLPGHPQLEATLRTAFTAPAPRGAGIAPDEHWTRALGWLQEAGLHDCRAHTTVAEVQAPLSDELREAMTCIFDMFWDELEHVLSDEERAEFQRLCAADSPENVLDQPDYYGFVTYTAFVGVRS